MNMQKDETPLFLFKILSVENWDKSQVHSHVLLSPIDEEFIHLAREDQLEKITEKFWSHVPEYVLLKLDTDQLKGELIYEKNPGGLNKYYHLYNGSIPFQAVSEVKFINPLKDLPLTL